MDYKTISTTSDGNVPIISQIVFYYVSDAEVTVTLHFINGNGKHTTSEITLPNTSDEKESYIYSVSGNKKIAAFYIEISDNDILRNYSCTIIYKASSRL